MRKTLHCKFALKTADCCPECQEQRRQYRKMRYWKCGEREKKKIKYQQSKGIRENTSQGRGYQDV